MKTYLVYRKVTCIQEITVEAKSKTEAKKIIDEANEDYSNFNCEFYAISYNKAFDVKEDC